MVSGRHKSRTFRRKYVRTPGAKTVVHYEKRKPSAPKCSACKKVLKGVPRLRDCDMKHLSKTQKRPERPYGGVLCSECMRKKIVTEARK